MTTIKEKDKALRYVTRFAETRHKIVSILYDHEMDDVETDAAYDAFASANPDEN